MTNYQAIETKMRLYREGLIALPKEFIEYHRHLAIQSLDEMRKVK